MHGKNNVSCKPFSQQEFIRQVAEASGLNASAPGNTQTKYLAQHLEQLGAKTLVTEDHYIDRHFMEEYSYYYARCFNQLNNSCKRVHVFNNEMDDQSLEEKLKAAASGKLAEIAEELQNGYRGFVVVRPLRSVPIGRTIVEYLSDDQRRFFSATSSASVHFLGMELEVKGSTFQQQDRAVGACATTAIWTALQQTCRAEGARQPSPSAITEAAVRHFIPHGRPFPSSGLTTEQICEAFRSFDFPPAVFQVKSPDDFLATLHIYLRSGIPVVLALLENDQGHAVTGNGYRATQPRPFTVGQHGFDSYNLAYDQIYMHDDRLGPYAKGKIKCPPATQHLSLEIPWPSRPNETLRIHQGIVPLYPKIRTSAEELIETATYWSPVIRQTFCQAGDSLGVEMLFQRSGTYSQSLYERDLDPSRLAEFQRKTSLSRYVGLTRWYVNGSEALDIVWDTTDRLRPESFERQVLGFVGYDQTRTPQVENLANLLEVPYC